MTPALRVLLAAAAAWLAHWTAGALPLVHAGPVAVPGFAATADLALLAVLAAVVWCMVLGPARRAERARAAMAGVR